MALPGGKKGHPGTPNLYDTSMPVAEGGLTFRARFGVTAPKQYAKGNPVDDNMLAVGSYSAGSEIKDGYPEFTMAMLMKLGWDKDLTAAERASIEKVAGSNAPEKVGTVNWKTDLSGGIQRVAIAHGCAPFGNAKARTVVWTFPDPVPLHREPLYTPRRDLLDKYATYKDRKHHRLPTLYESIQKKDFSKDYPDHSDVGTSCGVRGRWRREPVQPVAGRAAAEHVRRNQSDGCQ